MSKSKISQPSQKNHGIRLIGSDFQAITVIPTHRVHIKLPHTPRLVEQFTDDMKLHDFSWLLDRLQTTQGLQSIVFAGGEPALWAEIDPALYIARQHGVQTALLTDALSPPKKSLPDQIFINVYLYVKCEDLREQIEKTISYYQNNTQIVRLKLFRSLDLTKSQISLVESLAKRLKLPLDIEMGYVTNDLHCAKCRYARMTIHPDAKTVGICHYLADTAQLDDHLTLADLYEATFG